MNKIPLMVRISRPLLAKLQTRYAMPDMGNAFDELVARSMTMECARHVDLLESGLPRIQDADTAKTYYDLDPQWNSMKVIPEFRLRMSERFLRVLHAAKTFSKCETYQEIFRLILERGLWGEATDDPRPNMVAGFGNVGGILPISSKDTEDKIDVVLM